MRTSLLVVFAAFSVGSCNLGGDDAPAATITLPTTTTLATTTTSGPFTEAERNWLNLSAARRGVATRWYMTGLDTDADGYIDVSYEAAEQTPLTRELLDSTYELCADIAADARNAGVTPAEIIGYDALRGAITEVQAEEVRLAFVLICPERLDG